jgi:hypothetical protein
MLEVLCKPEGYRLPFSRRPAMRAYVLNQGIRVQTGAGNGHSSAWAIGNAVVEADDGAWLATWDCQMLELLLDEASLPIPAPEGWREIVGYEMFADQRAR